MRTFGCRKKAKGATFYEATEGETVRPMLDVAWAPMLGAFSVLFEEFPEGEHTLSICMPRFRSLASLPHTDRDPQTAIIAPPHTGRLHAISDIPALRAYIHIWRAQSTTMTERHVSVQAPL